MLKRLLIGLSLILPFLGEAVCAAPIDISSGTISLESTLLTGANSNPEIRAARGAADMARSRVSGSAAWPDPMLTFSKEKWPTGEKMNHVKVEQEIPFPGKLSEESDMKHHEAHI